MNIDFQIKDRNLTLKLHDLIMIGLGILVILIFWIHFLVVFVQIRFDVKNHSEITVEAGDGEMIYDAGATYKGEPMDVEHSGEVDRTKLGTYKITYTAGTAGVSKKITVNYQVADTEAPVLTLTGSDTDTVKQGDSYTDPGCTATDNLDTDLDSKVTVEGTVNTQEAGTYTLKYQVSDSSGNTATAERSVMVYDKVAYLTYDDGPCQYTDKLLDVLEEYGVNVTFFVTNQAPEYISCISRAYQDGNTIAVHSYSHSFSGVYASTSAYWSDFDKMDEIIYEQTGEHAWMLRFPGGSSNTRSNKYCYGIMKKLISGCASKGIEYCDWNVDSDDEGDASTADEVYNNVIEGIQKNESSIVLMHDIQNFTIEATPMIIEWCRENNCILLPLTPDVEMVHHI